MSGYFQNIKDAFSTLAGGLKLTMRYLVEARTSRKPIGIADESYFEVDKGIITLQYPYESLPVPENGRYRLHNEIDDCIVCDKCAKVCPVDCIEIDAIKAVETFGVTSDGTPKRIHAAKFDIDMSKCCFCGLCTTVCPTECLTMTKVYDFSEFDVKDHVYSFANMSLTEIAQKRKLLATAEAEKAAKAPVKEAAPEKSAENSTQPEQKPAFKPKVMMKPKPMVKEESDEIKVEDQGEVKPKPVFKPKPILKPKIQSTHQSISDTKADDSAEVKPAPAKPVMKPRPVMKPKINAEEPALDQAEATQDVQKEADTEKTLSENKPQRPRPVIKHKIEAKNDETAEPSESAAEKPKFRPKPMIPKKKKEDDAE